MVIEQSWKGCFGAPVLKQRRRGSGKKRRKCDTEMTSSVNICTWNFFGGGLSLRHLNDLYLQVSPASGRYRNSGMAKCLMAYS